MAYPTPTPTASDVATKRVRFENIGEAWKIFQANMGPWILITLVLFLLLMVAQAICLGPGRATIMAAMSADRGRNSDNINPIALFLGSPLLLIGSIAYSVIAYIFMGGFTQAAIKQLRGQQPAVSDLFLGLSKAVPLGIAGLLVSLGTMIGEMFFILPGLIFMGLSLLTMPFIMEQNMQPVDAIKKSIETLKADMWPALGYYLVFAIVASLGALACGIGMLFTLPLMPLGIALLYRDYCPESFRESGRIESGRPENGR
jgi:uncharacterized membrane protein